MRRVLTLWWLVMTGGGLLGVILLVFISDGAFGITTASTPEGAGDVSDDDLSLESPGPPFGWDVPREGRPMPRWVRGANDLPLQPDWDSAATWWMTSLAVGESCRQLLWDFAQSSASLVSCVVKNARPVRVCEECTPQFHSLWEAFANISVRSGEQVSHRLKLTRPFAMNLTQQLWSKTYNCIVPCSDTIPVIAVSTFLLFLPVIFYLSSFLHSEQKKWKLMEPKRLKPCSSTAHIEDRSS
ncbi:osteopetrosis-associated transmembrane protein 1 [Rhincodon typus]|uniref:osteopetrosis-associated transmembrane protein 1 n=1 Tax=Rhincodon typus TaxID=259920 RepID=UPI00202EFAC2|nr:osteopetrosis-associated transmembrane protein 1 [Rhincodon typus]